VLSVTTQIAIRRRNLDCVAAVSDQTDTGAARCARRLGGRGPGAVVLYFLLRTGNRRWMAAGGYTAIRNKRPTRTRVAAEPDQPVSRCARLAVTTRVSIMLAGFRVGSL